MAGPGTTFTGPLIVGPKFNADANGPANTGLVLLTQQATLTQSGTNTVSATLTLPPGSVILDIVADTTVAWNSGTSDTLSVGKSAGGTDYASGVSVSTAGRARPAFTGAQLAAMAAGIGTNTNVVATVTPVGTAATAGTTVVTVEYVQLVQNLDSNF